MTMKAKDKVSTAAHEDGRWKRFSSEIKHLKKHAPALDASVANCTARPDDYALGMLVMAAVLDSRKDQPLEQSSAIERTKTHLEKLISEIESNPVAIDALAGALTALACERVIKFSANKKKMKLICSGLEVINKAKAKAIERAKIIAAELWQTDTKQEIRIGEMAAQVYRTLSAEGFAASLPDTSERVKEWLKPVAPEYARKSGRSRKTSERYG